MRRFVLATAMVGMAFGAEAADLSDLPVLRGSLPPGGLTIQKVNWDGWYAGGQASYSAVQADFSKSIVGLTNYIFRDTVLQQPTQLFGLLPKTTTQGTGFGAFVGRNWQYDDLVFGLEANYNYFNSLATSANGGNSLQFTDPPGQSNPPGVHSTYVVTLSGQAAVQIKDAIEFRARTGWAVGNFLPYVFGGAVVGRMDASRTVTSHVTRRDDVTTTDAFGVTTTVFGPTVVVPAQSTILNEQKINQFVAGWSGGLGMEYCLWGGLFARGEWEFVKFLQIKNTAVQANNVRFGLGYKF
jgi:opacity protein-like surface antigen